MNPPAQTQPDGSSRTADTVPRWKRWLKRITLWLAALNPEALIVIERSPLGKTLGRERMFYNLQQAVEAYQSESK